MRGVASPAKEGDEEEVGVPAPPCLSRQARAAELPPVRPPLGSRLFTLLSLARTDTHRST